MSALLSFIKFICYSSLAYGNLELSRLILQYITMVYGIPLLPSMFFNLSPPNPTPTAFLLELGFVAIGVLFIIALGIKGIIDLWFERPVHGRCDRCVLRFQKVIGTKIEGEKI